MRIVVVGDFRVAFHEEALARALEALGCEVERFKIAPYFTASKWKFAARLQNRYSLGPIVNRVNRDLLKVVAAREPNAVFIYRGRCVARSTVERIKVQCASVIGYNNDDPFSPYYPDFVWRKYLSAVPMYSHIFAYRSANIGEYRAIGAQSVSLLRAFYMKERSYPVDAGELINSKYSTDFCFIGHYEPDGRHLTMEKIARCGLKFRLFGPEWERAPNFEVLQSLVGPIRSVTDDYNAAINSAKLALVLFSKLNRDTYTRRCFEIPATGRTMLCQHSFEMESLFAPDREAVYFRNDEDLIEKAAALIRNNEARNAIGAAGRKRLLDDGHEAMDRAEQILKTIAYLGRECRN